MNSVLTIQENGKLTLPDDIVERYQFKRETQFRIPITDEPTNDELKTELKEWQMIGADGWEMFD